MQKLKLRLILLIWIYHKTEFQKKSNFRGQATAPFLVSTQVGKGDSSLSDVHALRGPQIGPTPPCCQMSIPLLTAGDAPAAEAPTWSQRDESKIGRKT